MFNKKSPVMVVHCLNTATAAGTLEGRSAARKNDRKLGKGNTKLKATMYAVAEGRTGAYLGGPCTWAPSL